MLAETRVEGDSVLVMQVTVASLDITNARELTDIADPIISKTARVVLDLTSVSFVDSTGLGSLLACRRLALERQAHLRICGVRNTLRALLDLLRLTKLFAIDDDVAQSLFHYADSNNHPSSPSDSAVASQAAITPQAPSPAPSSHLADPSGA